MELINSQTHKLINSVPLPRGPNQSEPNRTLKKYFFCPTTGKIGKQTVNFHRRRGPARSGQSHLSPARQSFARDFPVSINKSFCMRLNRWPSERRTGETGGSHFIRAFEGHL